jgi:hypothetical protein
MKKSADPGFPAADGLDHVCSRPDKNECAAGPA